MTIAQLRLKRPESGKNPFKKNYYTAYGDIPEIFKPLAQALKEARLK